VFNYPRFALNITNFSTNLKPRKIHVSQDPLYAEFNGVNTSGAIHEKRFEEEMEKIGSWDHLTFSRLFSVDGRIFL